MASEKRFSYEWQNFPQIVPEHEEQFKKWVYPLLPPDFKNKVILDAGCGIGRNSFWALKYGASRLVAFDHDRKIVEVARANLKKFDNCEVYYGDIYDIPKKHHFDIAFSIGVVHHLKDPRQATEQLVKSVKKNGKVLIWVYGYEGNELLLIFLGAVRLLTSKLDPLIVRVLAFLPSIFVFIASRLGISKHPYFLQLRRFSYPHIQAIVFDQMLPTIANYWTESEAKDLLSFPEVKNVRTFRVNQNSWTVVGTKR